MIRLMINITQDTLKIKFFDLKTEAKMMAYNMNRDQPAARPWIVSKPNKFGKHAVMSLNEDGFLIYVSV